MSQHFHCAIQRLSSEAQSESLTCSPGYSCHALHYTIQLCTGLALCCCCFAPKNAFKSILWNHRLRSHDFESWWVQIRIVFSCRKDLVQIIIFQPYWLVNYTFFTPFNVRKGQHESNPYLSVSHRTKCLEIIMYYDPFFMKIEIFPVTS